MTQAIGCRYLLIDDNWNDSEYHTALTICKKLQLEATSVEHIPDRHPYLRYHQNRWALALNSTPPTYLSIDYAQVQWQPHRVRQGYQKSPLHRALGKHSSRMLLDACAGFGRDSMIFSSLGYQVTACERHPVIFFILEQAFHHIPDNRAKIPALINQNAIELLSTDQFWDVIYLDPMYPEDAIGKSQVKKTAQILRSIVNHNTAEDEELFQLARNRCRRLIVKRHIHATSLSQDSIDIQYCGQSTRYDVYIQPEKR